jgi:hypothetical protein
MPAEKSKPTSQRFESRLWVERLIPIILGGLVLALVVMIAIILLSVFGLTPGA